MKVTYIAGYNKCVKTVFGAIFPAEDAVNNMVRVTDHTGTALHPVEQEVLLPKYKSKTLTGLAASLYKTRYKKNQMPTKAGLDALVAEAMRGDSVPHVRKRTININPLKDAFNGINV